MEVQGCYCSRNLDLPNCEFSTHRSDFHHHSGCGGSREVLLKAAETLTTSGQVTAIRLMCSPRDGEWDLYFESCPNTCATQLCHYLLFEES
jgi:hypothetical protein